MTRFFMPRSLADHAPARNDRLVLGTMGGAKKPISARLQCEA